MSGISAGHGLSFPLQHNLGDDTAYSMMHVPAQAPANYARGMQQQAPPPHMAQDGHAAAPPGSTAAAWYPHAAPPMSMIPPALAPVYFTTAPQPPAVPHEPPLTEQRLRELLELIVARYFGQKATIEAGAGTPPAVSAATAASVVPAGRMAGPLPTGWLVAILVALGLVVVLCVVLVIVLLRRSSPRGRRFRPVSRRYMQQAAEFEEEAGDDNDAEPDIWIEQVSREVKQGAGRRGAIRVR